MIELGDERGSLRRITEQFGVLTHFSRFPCRELGNPSKEGNEFVVSCSLLLRLGTPRTLNAHSVCVSSDGVNRDTGLEPGETQSQNVSPGLNLNRQS